jgi:hypothetical protein
MLNFLRFALLLSCLLTEIFLIENLVCLLQAWFNHGVEWSVISKFPHWTKQIIFFLIPFGNQKKMSNMFGQFILACLLHKLGIKSVVESTHATDRVKVTIVLFAIPVSNCCFKYFSFPTQRFHLVLRKWGSYIGKAGPHCSSINEV